MSKPCWSLLILIAMVTNSSLPDASAQEDESAAERVDLMILGGTIVYDERQPVNLLKTVASRLRMDVLWLWAPALT